MNKSATKKPDTWVRVQCPRADCCKRLTDLFIDEEGKVTVLDMALESSKRDRLAPLTWTDEDWQEHHRKRELARQLLDEETAEQWPDVGRAATPELANEELGIRGPRTQYEGVRQVGRPSNESRILLRYGEDDQGVETLSIVEDDELIPWIFECSCGTRRIVDYETLQSKILKALSLKLHRIQLS